MVVGVMERGGVVRAIVVESNNRGMRDDLRSRLSLRTVSGRRLTYKGLTGKTLRTHRKEKFKKPARGERLAPVPIFALHLWMDC